MCIVSDNLLMCLLYRSTCRAMKGNNKRQGPKNHQHGPVFSDKVLEFRV